MVNEKKIRQVAAKIGKGAKAQRVILFGSHAKGLADNESDVDFLVIANSDLPRFRRSRKLYAIFDRYPFPMDILVYTPQEVEKGLSEPSSLISTIIKEGIDVYVA